MKAIFEQRIEDKIVLLFPITNGFDDVLLMRHGIRELVVGGSLNQVFLKLNPSYFETPAVVISTYLHELRNKQTVISLKHRVNHVY